LTTGLKNGTTPGAWLARVLPDWDMVVAPRAFAAPSRRFEDDTMAGSMA
jgi:hypothetical protein